MSKPAVKKSYTFQDRIYLYEIIKGLGITIRHFLANVRASLRPGPHTIPTTWQYPEDRTREISPLFRGAHMLILDDQGREKCVGCGMCARGCPAKCITVKRGKRKEGQEDRYVGKTYCTEFHIDLLRCIFCGYCEDSCPKGAIMLGPEFELAGYSRDDCQLFKDGMLTNFHRAMEEGKLRPPRKPVKVEGAAPGGSGAGAGSSSKSPGGPDKQADKTQQ